MVIWLDSNSNLCEKCFHQWEVFVVLIFRLDMDKEAAEEKYFYEHLLNSFFDAGR